MPSLQEQFDESGKSMFAMFNSLTKGGFSEQQALQLVGGMLNSVFLKNLEQLGDMEEIMKRITEEGESGT